MTDMQIVPAYKNVEAQYVEMMVPLYSYGCERKIKKALSNIRGIYSVKVDFELQKVTVWGICNKYDVLATIKSKRKVARFWDLEEPNQQPDFDSEEQQSAEPVAVIPVFRKPFISKLGRSLSWKLLKKVIIKSY